MDIHRIPPQNIDAERAVLGAMLCADDGKEAIAKVIEILGDNGNGNGFYREGHQKVYEAILNQFERGESVDLLTVTRELDRTSDVERVGGVSYLDGMIESVPSAANVEYYAQMVKQESLRRQLIVASSRAYNDSFDATLELEDILADTEKALIDIRKGSMVGSEVQHVKGVLKGAFEYIKEVAAGERKVLGLETGFTGLDKISYGLKPGDYIIVAGRPGVGKSMFMGNLVQNVAIKQKKPCLIFSLETSMQQLVLRFLAAEARVSLKRILSGDFDESHWPKLTISAGAISQAPIYIDDTPRINIAEVRAKCNQAAMSKPGLSAVFVDYLQLMTVKSNNRDRHDLEIAEISGHLRAIARSLNIPLVALSQLNRKTEGREDSRPRLSDLRESGALEQDADAVWFIYPEGHYDKTVKDDTAEIIIAKSRNGPTGTIKLTLLRNIMRFENMEERYAEREPGQEG